MRNEFEGPELRAWAAPFWHGIQLRYHREDTTGLYLAKPLVLEKVEEGAYAEPTLKLGLHAGQVLMDDLWRCGLRPSEGTGSAGAMAATERHLADMRKLVFEGAKEAKA